MTKTYEVKRHVKDHKANKTKTWLKDQALDTARLMELLKKPCDITRSRLGLTA